MAEQRPGLMRPFPVTTGVSAPVAAPIQPSVVYAAQTPDALDAQYEGRAEGHTYAREGHPNAAALAARIAAMEGCDAGIVTGSGMAAVAAALMGLLKAGDHVVGSDQLYGRSLRMLREELPRIGVEVSLADATRAEALAAALRPETRMILIETVSNPMLRVADLEGIAARARGVLLAVDNTFTTPRALRPFEHGADIVIHSVTKLLAGHADATLGWVGARDAGLAERMESFAVTLGLTASPFDCWLAERGLLTFELRYDRAEATAAALSDRIEGMPGVTRVLYPGRADHPDGLRAAALLAGRFCNMVTFEIAGGRAAANAFARAAGDAGLPMAPTLGDAGSTLSHPASSSHRGLTPEGRAALGISEGTFRLSVGLEAPEALAGALLRGAEAAAAA
ncbi:cystathionine gamma-synthase [Rhodosalinus halophilus]|uniref:Cystathionine gamma-synthase n=1 Tax=Rhodosalinus halophilus TaxID=2259333 RepID=A0A365U8R1_9RHOB|nr:aminotransferase class I/II-fold pyridoxal phosphate-dependent enzyme [Rhodosalinus halophilus]RBI85042.1 cystathionine gamma-synthase [Rhodosalinus halophilus]